MILTIILLLIAIICLAIGYGIGLNKGYAEGHHCATLEHKIINANKNIDM